MKAKKLLFVITLILFSSIKSFAQGEGNFWFFGYNAGVDFNSGTPVALTVGALNTDEGCASISGPAGNLLFYTDGINVWNSSHTTMPNGTGLLGDPSTTQSGIIVPKPGSTTTYYVFTAAATGGTAGLCYTEVDMTLDGGLGDVVTTAKNVPLTSPIDEKITAVKNSNNVDFWVIANGYMTADYYVYAVTSGGVTATPVISTGVGTPDPSFSGVGYLKSSSDGSKLVSAASNNNNVDVLNFNNTTGTITFDFNFSFVTPYGVEFSPNGSRLYVAGWNLYDIYQYDMTLGSSAAIIASETVIGTSISTIGALQNAPDGKMYATEPFSTYLGAVTYPDSLGVACIYVDSAIYLAGKLPSYGLPNFITSFFRGSAFDYVHTCVGDSTLFSLVDTITIDSMHWNFGDPASGINNDAYTDSVFHVFSAVGTYNVSLITYLGSVSDTSRALVEILGVPSIFIGNDTSICTGDSITLNAGSGYTYLWQDGSTQQTFRASAGGTYYVSATGPCATGHDTIQISAIPLPVVTVTDTSICVGQTAHLHAHGANTYAWPVGTTGSDSTGTASPPITTNYIITGTIGTCSNTDTATVTIMALPVVTATSAAICIGDTATLTAGGAIGYFWSTTDTTSGIEVHPSTTTTYTVTGISATGCSDSATGTVSVTLMPVISTSGDATLIAGFSTTLSASGGTGYLWSPETKLSCTTCANPIASPVKTTTYCVIVDNGLCVDSTCLTITVEQPCPAELGIPDAFSPNDDGNNDLFLLQEWSRCAEGFKIVIYDRWGEKVFESNDPNFSWDGTYKGKRMDPAVFMYIVRARLFDNVPVERKGNITLIR